MDMQDRMDRLIKDHVKAHGEQVCQSPNTMDDSEPPKAVPCHPAHRRSGNHLSLLVMLSLLMCGSMLVRFSLCLQIHLNRSPWSKHHYQVYHLMLSHSQSLPSVIVAPLDVLLTELQKDAQEEWPKLQAGLSSFTDVGLQIIVVYHSNPFSGRPFSQFRHGDYQREGTSPGSCSGRSYRT